MQIKRGRQQAEGERESQSKVHEKEKEIIEPSNTEYIITIEKLLYCVVLKPCILLYWMIKSTHSHACMWMLKREVHLRCVCGPSPQISPFFTPRLRSGSRPSSAGHMSCLFRPAYPAPISAIGYLWRILICSVSSHQDAALTVPPEHNGPRCLGNINTNLHGTTDLFTNCTRQWTGCLFHSPPRHWFLWQLININSYCCCDHVHVYVCCISYLQ